MRFLVFLILYPFAGITQVNTPTWGVNDTTICIVKSTDFFMPHDYLALDNFTGSALEMVWIRYTDPDWPVQWEVGFTDPDSVYTNVLTTDTGNFVLPYPVDFSNQLILNVDHNNHVDTSYLRFKVYPLNFPEDSLWLNYCVIIHLPDAGFSENNNSSFRVEFIREQRMLQVYGPTSEKYFMGIYSVNGVTILEQSFENESAMIDVAALKTGVYAIHMRSSQGTFSKKLLIY